MRDKIEEIIVGILMFPFFVVFGTIKGIISMYLMLHDCYNNEEEDDL